MPTKRTHQGLWGQVPLEPNQVLKASFGPLWVWIRRDHTDWFYAFERPGEESTLFGLDPAKEAPEDLDWNRLGCEKASRHIVLEPALPNRAVVVRPDMPLTILPGERIQFFVRVPLWIRLVATNKAQSMWCDLPTRVLSKTWFGSTELGEQAYALRTSAVRSLDDLARFADRVVCPVRLRNQSADVLLLNRLCLRVQHLGLYEGATSLWTNEAGVTYRGGDEWSRVVYGRAEPPFDQAKQKLAGARMPSRGAFTLKSIASGDFFT